MHYFFIISTFALCGTLYGVKQRIVIDQLAATIHGPMHTKYICSSDLIRPSLEGQLLSIDKAIEQELVIQDMESFKMTTGDEGDKHVKRIKKERNLSDQDLETMFQQTGRSTKEAIEELTRLQQYHGMEHMQTYANVFVSAQEIEQYYLSNPLYTEAEYTLSRAIIPYEQDKALQVEHIVSYLKHDDTQMPWSTPIVIQEHELSDHHKDIIRSIKSPGTAGPFVHKQGYEIIKLIKVVPSELICFKQRQKTIKACLEQSKAEQFLKKYHTDLRDKAVVAYKQLSPAHKTF